MLLKVHQWVPSLGYIDTYLGTHDFCRIVDDEIGLEAWGTKGQCFSRLSIFGCNEAQLCPNIGVIHHGLRFPRTVKEVV